MQEETQTDYWRQLKRPIAIIGGFVVLLWLIEGVDQLIFRQSLDNFGVHPRSLVGLWGIIWAPFLHRGFQHLIANTGPILVLGTIICCPARCATFSQFQSLLCWWEDSVPGSLGRRARCIWGPAV